MRSHRQSKGLKQVAHLGLNVCIMETNLTLVFRFWSTSSFPASARMGLITYFLKTNNAVVSRFPKYSLDGFAHILCLFAHIRPVRLCGNDKAFIRYLLGVGFIMSLSERIRESLVEQQREDVLLVIVCIHQSAQDGRRASQEGFEFGLGQAVNRQVLFPRQFHRLFEQRVSIVNERRPKFLYIRRNFFNVSVLFGKQ